MFSSRLPSVLAVSAALCFAVGCSKSATTSQQYPEATASASKEVPPEQPLAPPQIEHDCPMIVPGAQARAEDTPEGVALTIVTTEEDKVADVRELSRRLMQRQQERGTAGRRGEAQPPGVEYKNMGGSGLPGSAGAPTVPAAARIEDIPGGSVITYRASDPKHQDQLSSDIHGNAEKMTPGQCPGMAAPVK
ncbi:hypothetical protein [Pyxidicoccus sp. MSG2]|uniref:hypothetical protein n=1 Tax=Pyxidicoccus sp. MSG2 TaxID=2996790 RepID=UPI002270DB50|nr:hypothetical protein [Pyxidicoccus sp. MSG2]MCY1015823.1 hypothetical protein [Pyxidicoccus sp. MSG2]